MGAAGVHGKLQKAIRRRGVSNRESQACRVRVAEHERHRRAAADQVLRKLVLEWARRQHVADSQADPAESAHLGRFAEPDDFAKQSERARLQENNAVDATQRDGAGASALRHLDRSVHVIRHAQCVREVVECSQRNDADPTHRVGETSHHRSDRAITPGDDDRGARRDHLADAADAPQSNGVESRKVLAEAGIDVGGHASRARVQDQQPRSSHRSHRLSNPAGSSVTELSETADTGTYRSLAKGGYEVLVALIVLILLLLLFGGGGLVSASLNFLWWILISGLVLWVLGFFFRAAEGGGRWYYW